MAAYLQSRVDYTLNTERLEGVVNAMYVPNSRLDNLVDRPEFRCVFNAGMLGCWDAGAGCLGGRAPASRPAAGATHPTFLPALPPAARSNKIYQDMPQAINRADPNAPNACICTRGGTSSSIWFNPPAAGWHMDFNVLVRGLTRPWLPLMQQWCGACPRQCSAAELPPPLPLPPCRHAPPVCLRTRVLSL